MMTIICHVMFYRTSNLFFCLLISFSSKFMFCKFMKYTCICKKFLIFKF